MGKRTICSAYTIWSLVLLLTSTLACAHPGGRGSNGGQRDGSAGRYHFHEGLLAGQEFATKEEAVAALNAASTPPVPTDPSYTPSTPSDFADSITVASWNIRNLSDDSRSDAELGIISLIIFRYDLSPFRRYETLR